MFIKFDCTAYEVMRCTINSIDVSNQRMLRLIRQQQSHCAATNTYVSNKRIMYIWMIGNRDVWMIKHVTSLLD